MMPSKTVAATKLQKVSASCAFASIRNIAATSRLEASDWTLPQKRVDAKLFHLTNGMGPWRGSYLVLVGRVRVGSIAALGLTAGAAPGSIPTTTSEQEAIDVALNNLRDQGRRPC